MPEYFENRVRNITESFTDPDKKARFQAKIEARFKKNFDEQARQETKERIAARRAGRESGQDKLSLARAETRIKDLEQKKTSGTNVAAEASSLQKELKTIWSSLDTERVDFQADRDALGDPTDPDYVEIEQQMLALGKRQVAYESLLARLDKISAAGETDAADQRAKTILEARATDLEAFNNSVASFNPDDFLENLRAGLTLLADGEKREVRTALRFVDALGTSKAEGSKDFDTIAADEARIEAEKRTKTELNKVINKIKSQEQELKNSLNVLVEGFDRGTNWGQLSTAISLFEDPQYARAFLENAAWQAKLQDALQKHFESRLTDPSADAVFTAALAAGGSELSQPEKEAALQALISPEAGTLSAEQQTTLKKTLIPLIEKTMKYRVEAAAAQTSESKITGRASGTETLTFGADQIKLDAIKKAAERDAHNKTETALRANDRFNPDLDHWDFLQWALNHTDSPFQMAENLERTTVDFATMSDADRQTQLDSYAEAFFALTTLSKDVQKEFERKISGVGSEFQEVIKTDFHDVFVDACEILADKLRTKVMEIYQYDPGIKQINRIGFEAVSSTGTDKDESKRLSDSFAAIKTSLINNPTVRSLGLQKRFDSLYLNSIAGILEDQKKFKGEYEKLVSAHNDEGLGDLLRQILRHEDGVNPSGSGAMAKTLEIYVRQRVDRALQNMRERAGTPEEKEKTEKIVKALQELFGLFYAGNKEDVFNASDGAKATISLTDMAVNVDNMTQIVRGEELRKIIEDMGYNELFFGEGFSWYAYDMSRFDFYHNHGGLTGALAQTELDPSDNTRVEKQKGGIVADFLKAAFDILRKDFHGVPKGLPELYATWEASIKGKYEAQKTKLETWENDNDARINAMGNAVDQAAARKEFNVELAKRKKILEGYNITKTDFLRCSMYGGTFDGEILMNFLSNYFLSDTLDEIAPAQDLDTPIEEWDDNNPRYIVRTIAETMLATFSVARQANNLAMNVTPGQAPMSTQASGEWKNTTENMIYQCEKIDLQDANLLLLMSHNLPKGEYDAGRLTAIDFDFQYHAPKTTPGVTGKDWHTEIWPVRQFQEPRTEAGRAWQAGDLFARAERKLPYQANASAPIAEYDAVIQVQARERGGELRRSAYNSEDKVYLVQLDATGNVVPGSELLLTDPKWIERYRITYRIDPEFCLVDKENSPFEKQRAAYEAFMGEAGHSCWTPDFFRHVRCQIDSYANGATQGSTFNLFLMQQREISSHSYGSGYEKMLNGWKKMMGIFLSEVSASFSNPKKLEESLRKLNEEAKSLGSALSLVKANTVGGEEWMQEPNPSDADYAEKMKGYRVWQKRKQASDAFLSQFRYIREAFMQKVKYRQAQILTSFFPSWDRSQLPMGLNPAVFADALKAEGMGTYDALVDRYFDILMTRNDTAFGKDEKPTEFSFDMRNFLQTYQEQFRCKRQLTTRELMIGRANAMRAMVENIAKGPSLVFANYSNGRDFSSWKPIDYNNYYIGQALEFKKKTRDPSLTMESLLDPYSPFFYLCDTFFGDIYAQFATGKQEAKVEEGKK